MDDGGVPGKVSAPQDAFWTILSYFTQWQKAHAGPYHREINEPSSIKHCEKNNK